MPQPDRLDARRARGSPAAADPSRPFKLEFAGDRPLAHALRARAAGPLERLLGVDRLNDLYARCAGAGDATSFLHRVLDELGVRFRLPAEDLARVPRSGPLVVVANHPFGALDGIVLAAALGAVRPDVKVMANY